MPPSDYEKFQTDYEDAATRAYQKHLAQPLASLLDRARAGAFKDDYQLWHAIAAKGSLKDSGWTLFDVLQSKADYLDRYHCAAALIKLAGLAMAAYTPVMLSVEKAPGFAENIRKAAAMLEAAIGPRAIERS